MRPQIHSNSINKFNFFTCEKQFTYINSITPQHRVRIENGVAFSPSSYFNVFISENSRTLYFYLINGNMICCQLIQQSENQIDLSDPVKDLLFIDDNTLYITHSSKCKITIMRIEQLYEMLIVYVKNTLQVCYYDLLYNEVTQQLVMFHQNNTMVSYLLYTPDTPIRLANIPLFYDIQFLVHKRTGQVIAMNLDDGFYLLAKDTNEQVIYAYYRLGIPVHESQLLAHYFENKTAKASVNHHILASVFEESHILAASTHRADYLNNVGYFVLFTQHYRGVAGLNAEEFLFVEYIINDYLPDDGQSVNIMLLPGIDEITKQNRTRILHDQGSLIVSVKLVLSGLYVKSSSQSTVTVMADSNFEINLNQFFYGDFLNYKIACPSNPELCNQNGAVSLVPAYKKQTLDVSQRLRSSNIIELFDIGDFGVLVEKGSNLLFGYNFTDYMQYSRIIQLVDVFRYSLENARNFYYFADDIDTNTQFRFLVFQAFNTTSQFEVLCIFQFSNQINLVNQDLFAMKLLYSSQLNYDIKNIHYSYHYHRFFVTYTQSEVHNYMDVIELFFDDSTLFPQAAFLSKIDIFSTLIAPFVINSSGVFQPLPFIFLGLQGKGILVVHAYTLQTLCVFDIQKYININLHVGHYWEAQISNIMILGDNLIGFMVNSQGTYVIHLGYQSIHLEHTRFAFYYGEEIAPYFYAKYRLREPLLQTPNSVILQIAGFFLSLDHADSSEVPSVQQELYSVWLSYDPVYEQWHLNLLDFFKSSYSKQTLNMQVAREQQCTQLFVNKQPHFPKTIKVFVFCNSKNGTSYLYNYNVSLSQALYFNLDSLQGYPLNQHILDVEIEAANPITSIRAYTTVKLHVLEREPQGYLPPLAGLLGGVIILGLMVMIYQLGALCRHRLEQRENNPGKLTFVIKKQDQRGSDMTIESSREMEMSFYFEDRN